MWQALLYQNVSSRLIIMISLRILNYTIYASFSDGPSFDPKSIIVDDPENAYSRWSAGNNRASWILLKLDKLAVVRKCSSF